MKATTAAPAMSGKPERQGSLVGNGGEVDGEYGAADQDDREDAAEVVDRIGRLVDVRRHEPNQAIASATNASGSVSRKTEPHQKCSSRKPESSGPSEAIAPPRPDQSAIDFVRPGPDQSAVISASVVGYAMPAARPPPRRATKSTVSVGAQAASRHMGIATAGAEDQHQLAPIPVAKGAEIEHRRGEPERVADRDQVERRSGPRRTRRRSRAAPRWPRRG